MFASRVVRYGKDQFKDSPKRMVDPGRAIHPAEPTMLRTRYLAACGDLAASIWPASILDERPSGPDPDAVMLRTEAGLKGTLNPVRAGNARSAATCAVPEQLSRARNNLLGRFRHLATAAGQAMADGVRRPVEFGEGQHRGQLHFW